MSISRLKKVYFLFSFLLVSMVHLPFSFAEPKELKGLKYSVKGSENSETVSLKQQRLEMFETLQLGVMGLSRKAYNYAIDGLCKLSADGKISNDQIISIVDFTKSSAEKRLFVIDLENHTLLYNTYVAHGQNSGTKYAENFSNNPESFKSSLGFYQTSGTYNGKNGYSMQLQGLESGFNENAGERAIVMHGAPYVSEGFIRAKGYIGRSHGCPAVPEKLTKPIINKIKNGTCLFIYSENKNYLSKSRILNS